MFIPDSMADMNIPANNVPTEHAPAVIPPTRKDDQILLAFTASSMIPAIYIQQFWDTMCFNSSTGLYNYQLDEQWFNLHKDILRDALDITPANDNNPFEAPPSSDTVKRLDLTGQDIMCFRFFRVSLITPTLTMLNGFGRSLFNPYILLMQERNFAWIARGKKKTLHLLIPNVRFIGKDGREVFGMPISDALLTDEITKHGKVEEEDVIESPKAAKATKSKIAKPLQLVDEFVDEDVPEHEPVYSDEEADIQRAGKGKDKVSDEHVSLDLLTLQTPKKKRHVEQYIFQSRTPTTIEPSGHVESLSLYAKLDESHSRSNPGDATESQPQSSHAVHARPNLEHMDFEVTNASTQQNPEQMDEEIITTAYPSVQENLKLPTEDQVILEEPARSAGTLSSLQNLDKELSFTNQFLVEKS
ncbi:hypothetical protein Tco_1133097 [Tanacetum coccineum]|uniref:Uncharacterized protein n=1 Tax=Tanacetum coccineum TaxID=301880 RepID=A0ABQ5JEU1_9ASTR